MSDWTTDIENILENIRSNSVFLSQYHKEMYYKYKKQVKYFKIPLIILSSITSIVSVGVTKYMDQEIISLMTCALSFISSVIASIEVYLGIQKSMEVEFIASRNFLILSYDIFKILSLKRENRAENAKKYLDEKCGEYNKLIENSELLKSNKINDNLITIPQPYRLSKNMEITLEYNKELDFEDIKEKEKKENIENIENTQTNDDIKIQETIIKHENNNSNNLDV